MKNTLEIRDNITKEKKLTKKEILEKKIKKKKKLDKKFNKDLDKKYAKKFKKLNKYKGKKLDNKIYEINEHADNIILSILSEFGFPETLEAFENLPKLYD
jgi:DNA-directed RNA polymerase subunit F